MITLALLTGAALSLGLQAERSAGISEPGIPVGAVLRVEPEGWRGEATWSSADKDQGNGSAPCCWRASASLDREAGPLLVGAGWTHRAAADWTKDRAWLRGSARWRWARLTLRSALTSRDRESDAEVTARIQAGRITVEPEWGWTLFDQGRAAEDRRWSARAALRVLLAVGAR